MARQDAGVARGLVARDAVMLRFSRMCATARETMSGDVKSSGLSIAAKIRSNIPRRQPASCSSSLTWANSGLTTSSSRRPLEQVAPLLPGRVDVDEDVIDVRVASSRSPRWITARSAGSSYR